VRTVTPGRRRLTGAGLQALRDRRFRRRPSLAVRSERAALTFVDAVGFCSTFYRFPEGVACLWEAVVGRADPRWPRRSHHDPGIGRTWELKDVLPAKRHVYYGKLLRGRPMLVARDLFPAFYALVRGRQRAHHFTEEYAAGRLSHTAHRLLGALMREHPQYTRELRASAFMLESRRTREFERAMAELQQGLWIVKTEERYEPSFSYRWDLLEAWAPELTAAGRRLGREPAIARLVERYLRGAVFTTERALARLLGLRADEVARAVARLERAGALCVGVAVEGWPGRFVVHASAAGGD